MIHAYWGTIQSVDDSVGRLVKHLEETKQLENTVIVFMGDNGLLEGEHGMVDKRTAHEASLRIPLMVKFAGPRPPAQRPRVISQQVLTLDIAPSLLELCKAIPLKKIDGQSWVTLVREGDPTWRKSWFYEYNYEKQFPYTPNVRAVLTDDWKYIHYPPGDGSAEKHMAELYDLKNDPEERRNLIADPKLAGKVSELRIELARLMKESGLMPETDKMPVDEGIKTALPDQKIR